MILKKTVNNTTIVFLNDMSVLWKFNIPFSRALVALPFFTDESEIPKMIYMHRATIEMNLGLDLYFSLI
jgi:hypothetical protein